MNTRALPDTQGVAGHQADPIFERDRLRGRRRSPARTCRSSCSRRLAAGALAPGAGDPLAVAGECLQDFVSAFRPRERLRVLVPLVDPLAGVALEFGDAAVG